MRTVILLVLLFLSFSLCAQERKKSFHLYANTLFGENTKNGIGLGMKFLSGSNGKDFFSLNASFNLFPLKSTPYSEFGNKKTLPLMTGYQRRFGNFYVEPQVGYGVYAGRMSGNQEVAYPSQGAFFWGVETGCVFKKLSIQFKYQSAHTSKNEYLGRSFSYVAAGVAYNISPNTLLKK